jgi:hypothetical protein
MIKFICVLILVSVISGCKSPSFIDELELKGDKYYAENSKTPYSGNAIARFDDGKLSAKIKFENGVPNGNWYVYGFNNEIIQQGEYKPFSFNSEGISRLNLYKFREGDYQYSKVLLITTQQHILDTGKIEKALLQFFLEKSIKFPGDTLPEIQVVPGELSYLNH